MAAATLPSVPPLALPYVISRPTTRFHAPELDVLRLGAFLLVFCRHVATSLGDARHAAVAHSATVVATAAAAVPASRWNLLQEAVQSFDFGVCLFFFLSSFLITRLLLLEQTTTGTVDVGKFYMRRILRIWPLYFLFLLAVLLLSHVLPLLAVSPSRFLAAVLFVANWAAVLHGWQGIAIQPLWSISVEEQFYAVWPWLARLKRTFIIRFSAALMLVSMATLWFLGGRPGLQLTSTWPNTLVQGLFLAGGALAACLSSPESNRFRSSTRILLILCGFALWIIASAGFHIVRGLSPGPGSLMAGYSLVLVGTALIFYGVAGWNSRSLPKSLVLLGRMSYGLYVFHVAVLLALYNALPLLLRATHSQLSPYATVGVVSVAGLGVTILLAFGSYRYVEAPFLRLKTRFAVIASRPV